MQESGLRAASGKADALERLCCTFDFTLFLSGSYRNTIHQVRKHSCHARVADFPQLKHLLIEAESVEVPNASTSSLAANMARSHPTLAGWVHGGQDELIVTDRVMQGAM